jgi:DNA-binding response OmpR family regulator
VREGLARQLAEGGYAVEQASTGFAAGAAAARFQPDLVVLWASSGDGGGVVSGLRTDRELREVPVVAIGPPDWSSRLAEAGCTAVLSRPLADEMLLAAAGEVLGRTAAKGARSSSR